jgi:hypothetical protein
MRKQDGEKMAKKKWSKPECKKVKLVPEEAVITGCKHGQTLGPSGAACYADRCSRGTS